MYRKSEEADQQPHPSLPKDTDQAHARLLQAEQLIDSLEDQLSSDTNSNLMTSMFAHEVNNLMAQVGGRSQLALMNPDRNDLAHKALEIACNASSQVAQLAEFFLGSQSSSFSSQPRYSVESIYRQTLEYLRDQQSNHVCFIFKQSDAQTRTSVSPVLLQQVLLNMYLNSVRAIDANIDCEVQTVTTHVEHLQFDDQFNPTLVADSKSATAEDHRSTWNNSVIQITIEDSGIGMTQSEIKEILENPSHSHSKRKKQELTHGMKSRVSKGYGLGLVVCKELIAHANGSLMIESTPGHGTKMIIKFPEVFDHDINES